MTDKIKFVYGFEYEEHADAFLSKASSAGYEAALDTRHDGIEAVSVTAERGAESELDRLAEASFGYSLGARPTD
jgi:hypothetical protein